MHRHVIAHGNDPRLGIEDGAGVVAPLLYVGRESRAPQGRAHLLGNAVHRALKDRQLYRIGSGIMRAPPVQSRGRGFRSHPPAHSNPAAMRWPKYIR